MPIRISIGASRVSLAASIAIAAGCSINPVTRSSSNDPPSPPASQLPSRLPENRPTPPKLQASSIGTSVEGRAIECVRFGGASNLPPILIFAGIHGDERSTVAVARKLIDLLRDSTDQMTPSVVILPLVNPDGYERRTRTNARGVDLNRNFPAENFRASSRGRYANGQSPLSEPESIALHQFVERLKPSRILTLHSIRPPKHGNNFDGPAEALAKLLASKNGYNVLPTMGYATPGSFGSWAGVDRKIPTITLELPANASADRAWTENREALLAFIRGR